MAIQYAIVGGKLKLDKKVFAREMLMAESPLKSLLKVEEGPGMKPPTVTKTDQYVTVDYNEASDVLLDERFYDLLKKLKSKYQGNITGRVVIRITALTSCHVILDMNYEDGRIVYE